MPQRSCQPAVESCEGRTLTTLVFVLNGNSFMAASPSILTADAASVLRRAGERPVQVSYAAITSPAAFRSLAASLVRLAHGEQVGLVGFSAGGALSLRLAATPGLDVEAVLDYYGVPDVRAYLARHGSDRPISGLAPFRRPIVSLLSGPLDTEAHVVAAFGQRDPNVRPGTSDADLLDDDPTAACYAYPGGHGVAITASKAALGDFLSHLT